LPGERIRIEDKTVYINDEPLDETYAVFSDLRGEAATEGRDSLWEIIVPEDSYFMLGDNRDNSYDSRFYGPVPGDLVTGRPLFIYWSFDASTSDYLAETAWEKFKFALSTALNFFSRTRWDRTFRPIR
jgi:signal peptidase I